MTTESHDIAIIGGGPAGLSAALVLGRARRRVVVVEIVRPGTNLNPADTSYGERVLQPDQRRR